MRSQPQHIEIQRLNLIPRKSLDVCPYNGGHKKPPRSRHQKKFDGLFFYVVALAPIALSRIPHNQVSVDYTALPRNLPGRLDYSSNNDEHVTSVSGGNCPSFEYVISLSAACLLSGDVLVPFACPRPGSAGQGSVGVPDVIAT
ncbi:hypothetical protein [Burkholderia ubonensis]|uniref:hypothetical protein n=1 Tax=Burkholderia ubonensis TaxID=101571 RepID=UPI0010560B09|nr:hypothetical protein [Burkholderia ubonensis]